MKASVIQRIAEALYVKLQKSTMAKMLFPEELQQDILLSGKSVQAYYVGKIMYTFGLLLVGMIAGGIYMVCSMCDLGEPVTELVRPTADGEVMEHTLKAEGIEDSYTLELAPVVLTAEEAERQFEEAVAELERYICGKNSSLDQITDHLDLPERLEGYPFEIYWASDREDIVDSVGTVKRERLTEDTIVILTAEFYYGERFWQEQFGVQVLKEDVSESVRKKRALGDFLLAQEEAGRDERIWKLPDTFEGNAMHFFEVQTDYTVLWLALLTAAAGLIIWFGQDYDLQVNKSKRRNLLQDEYATLVNSLSLYISAGMTLQGAMLYCAGDYERRKGAGHPVCKALVDFRKEMENGYSFSVAVSHFAEQCDEPNYKKLAGLLSQGMANGAKGLTASLEQEVVQVNEEKRRRCKVKGEQVSTALIAPMILQLGIVIALIMLPAFQSMQF